MLLDSLSQWVLSYPHLTNEKIICPQIKGPAKIQALCIQWPWVAHCLPLCPAHLSSL